MSIYTSLLPLAASVLVVANPANQNTNCNTIQPISSYPVQEQAWVTISSSTQTSGETYSHRGSGRISDSYSHRGSGRLDPAPC